MTFSATPRRRWFRFSLGTGFLVIAFCAMVLGCLRSDDGRGVVVAFIALAMTAFVLLIAR